MAEILTCETCGNTFEHVFTNAGGRPPKHCPAHRKKRGEVIDFGAARQRRADVRQRQRDLTAARTNAVEDLSRAALIAAALPAFGDERIAALSVGLDLGGPDLARLASLARAHYPALCAGQVAGVAALVTRALAILAQRAIDTAHLLAPRDLAIAARNLVAVRESLLGEGAPKHAFSSFQIVIRGPNGEEIELPPNQAVDDEAIEQPRGSA